MINLGFTVSDKDKEWGTFKELKKHVLNDEYV